MEEPASTGIARMRTATPAIVALVALAVLVITGSASFVSASRWVEHTIEVRSAVERWGTVMVEAESSMRGYAISGRPGFRDAHESAMARERAASERLRRLMDDSARQAPNVEAAEAAAVDYVAFMRATVALVRDGQRDEVMASIAEGEGPRRIALFREAIARIDAEEDRVLVERRAAASRGWGILVLGLVACTAMAGVFFALAWSSQRRLESALREAVALRAARESEKRAADERARVAGFQERFIAVLGHDLRNPLNSIMMALGYLERRGLSPDLMRTLVRAKSSSERMRRMIDQILDFTRARVGGGIPLSREDMDFGKLVEEVVEEARIAHPGRAIDLQLQGDAHGAWDTDRLGQVVSNLVGNAVTHGADHDVHVRVDGGEGVVTLEIDNDGEIAEGVVDGLFDPFRGSGHMRTARSAGLGLGLYISDQVVKAHGGTLAVASGGGRTVFRVRLPRGAREGPGQVA